jgi:hypothetical protein
MITSKGIIIIMIIIIISLILLSLYNRLADNSQPIRGNIRMWGSFSRHSSLSQTHKYCGRHFGKSIGKDVREAGVACFKVLCQQFPGEIEEMPGRLQRSSAWVWDPWWGVVRDSRSSDSCIFSMCILVHDSWRLGSHFSCFKQSCRFERIPGKWYKVTAD